MLCLAGRRACYTRRRSSTRSRTSLVSCICSSFSTILIVCLAVLLSKVAAASNPSHEDSPDVGADRSYAHDDHYEDGGGLRNRRARGSQRSSKAGSPHQNGASSCSLYNEDKLLCL